MVMVRSNTFDAFFYNAERFQEQAVLGTSGAFEFKCGGAAI
jgi:hypothetical protein